MSLWEHFLDRHGRVRPGIAADFIRQLSTTTNTRNPADAFPLQALAMDTPIAQFYRFYGLEAHAG
ncbi:hypothetical protein BST28156_02745 [Burkholderia stagnalis]|nr:hypothetical protein BST28156_02745 [Burkholderia stagnalis]